MEGLLSTGLPRPILNGFRKKNYDLTPFGEVLCGNPFCSSSKVLGLKFIFSEQVLHMAQDQHSTFILFAFIQYFTCVCVTIEIIVSRQGLNTALQGSKSRLRIMGTALFFGWKKIHHILNRSPC